MKQFQNNKYMNIETFRKNGQGVKTPVWFVQDGEALRVWTFYGAGKTKRIRRNGTVRVVPSTASGEPLGEWISAEAIADHSPETIRQVEVLMRKKYGFAFAVFNLLGKIRGSKPDTIKVTFN